MNTFPLETFTENLLPLYPGYHISEYGDVYSRLNRYGKLKWENFWRQKKICTHKSGYFMTMMVRNDGLQRAIPIHHLVALAYLGPRPSGLYVCHFDGSKTNNHKSNLRYDTPRENSQDRERHGRTLKGERLPDAVLKEYQILEVFNLACTGMEIKEIAQRFNVTPPTISQVIKRNKWKHVPIDEILVQKAQNYAASGLTLSEEDVIMIFRLRAEKISKKYIANRFKVAEKTIRDILTRKIMPFVPVDDELIRMAQQHANKYSRSQSRCHPLSCQETCSSFEN